MEMVRLNIAYDLLQTTKLTSNTKENDKILERTNQVYFVICNSCYWCATFFGIDDLETLHHQHTFLTVMFVIRTIRNSYPYLLMNHLE
jgi:hypothetical protein